MSIKSEGERVLRGGVRSAEPAAHRRPGRGGLLAYRPTSTPERLGATLLAAAVATLAYPTVSRLTGLHAFCPLRSLTGVPCPFCGMTTAATALAAGRLEAALEANPFVLLLAGFAAAMAALMGARALGLAPPPAAPWPPGRQRLAWWAAGALALASWLVQLRRFSWL